MVHVMECSFCKEFIKLKQNENLYETQKQRQSLHPKCFSNKSIYVFIIFKKRICLYDVKSIVIGNAVASVFLLVALSFSRASLHVVFFLSQLCRFEVARSVPLSQL